MDSQSSSSFSSSTHEANNCKKPKRRGGSGPQSGLHSVRKLPAKPWNKMPIAPLPPTPPRVYKVDSAEFKQVVQRLTTAREFQSSRLQSVAPPPLDLSTAASSVSDIGKVGEAETELLHTPKTTSALSEIYRELMSETTEAWKVPDGGLQAVSPPGLFGLSPTSAAWCSFPLLSPLLSPGTLSGLEQGTVL